MAAAETEVASPLIVNTASDTSGTAAASAAAAVAAAADRTGSQAQVSKAALAAKLMSLSGVFAVHKPKGPTSAELLNRLKEKLLAEAGMPSPEWNKRQKQTLKVGHGGTLDSAAQGVLAEATKVITRALFQWLNLKWTFQSLCVTKESPPTVMVPLAQGVRDLNKHQQELPRSGWDWERNKNGDQYVVGVQGGMPDSPVSLRATFAIPSWRYIATGELGKATDTLDSTGKVTAEKPYDKITQEDTEGILQKFTGNIMQVPSYVECGGGFYIRSLVSDIGKELASCASVLELTRTKQGPFMLAQHALPEDRWTIDDIARSLQRCPSLLPKELTFKKSKSENSSDQVLSCGYITLRETEREDDAVKTP